MNKPSAKTRFFDRFSNEDGIAGFIAVLFVLVFVGITVFSYFYAKSSFIQEDEFVTTYAGEKEKSANISAGDQVGSVDIFERGEEYTNKLYWYPGPLAEWSQEQYRGELLHGGDLSLSGDMYVTRRGNKATIYGWVEEEFGNEYDRENFSVKSGYIYVNINDAVYVWFQVMPIN